ncbi:MAG: YraN family protein [Deltaproteobacteria bacterium]|nr:MAG: YraN family protein [Deltaproteobacteria bacterium]
MTSRRLFGDAGEGAAAELLRARGYRIIARNHRCRRGEVDLVAEKGELLVFVEVRTRATAVFGGPEETVSPRKQARVIAAARDFLMRWRGPERGARFDVVAVVDAPGGPRLEHFENAFDSPAF